MLSSNQTFSCAAVLVFLIRLVLAFPEQRFAQRLLSANVKWSSLGTAHLFDIKEGALWKFYLWSFRWRRLDDVSLQKGCSRWLILDFILLVVFAGLVFAGGRGR